MDKSVFFGWREIEAVYQSIKTDSLGIAVYSVAISIALIVMIIRGSKTFPELLDKETGSFDMKALFMSIYPYLVGLVIVTAMPVIISTIEKALSYIEQATMASLGTKQAASVSDALAKELIEKMGNGGFSLAMDFSQMLDMVGILFFKPLFAFLDQWMFAGALAIRYLYLIALELVAPIAVVALMSKGTEAWFYTWAKNMLACYLMIPMFLLGIAIAEGLKYALITDSGITTPALFFVVCLKLSLLAAGRSLVFKLI